MRDYAKVVPKMWHGKTIKNLRKRGPEGVIVCLYLMSSPMSNMLGLFTQPLMYIAHETGLGMEGATKGLQDCIDEGFCKFDHETETVWVIEMASYQIASELKASDLRVKGVQKDFDALQNGVFADEFFARYESAFRLEKTTPYQAPTKPLPSQEQEQEQEQEQKQEHSEANASGAEAPAKLAEDMTKDELWSVGKSLLTQAGMPAKQCGSFVGKLVKDYSNEIVVDAVRAAVVARPADPAEYLKAACMRASGQRPTRPLRPSQMTDDERAAFNATVADKAKHLLFGSASEPADVIENELPGVTHEAV